MSHTQSRGVGSKPLRNFDGTATGYGARSRPPDLEPELCCTPSLPANTSSDGPPLRMRCAWCANQGCLVRVEALQGLQIVAFQKTPENFSRMFGNFLRTGADPCAEPL